MKTYLFDTFKRFRRYSERLDAKTVLCNRCWWVFNDNGEKETYIFNEDGTIVITNNGVVTDGTWQYMSVNRSVILRTNNQKIMVIPSFIDDVILSLQVDGTNQYAFLIDEQNKALFAPKTLSAINCYFEEKEKHALELQKEEERKAEEQRKLEEAERIKKEQEKYKEKANDIYDDWDNVWSFWVSFSFFSGLFACVYIRKINPFNFKENIVIVLAISALVLIPCCLICLYFHYLRYPLIRRKYKKYVENNPDSPLIPYLTELCKKFLK